MQDRVLADGTSLYETAASLPIADVAMSVITELARPPDVEPLHWHLLTTHETDDAASAWQAVNWYKKRWTIEQLFRILKTQGLQIEDSRVETADRLLKLTAIARS